MTDAKVQFSYLRVCMPDLLLCISRHQDSPQTPVKELTGPSPLENLLQVIKSSWNSMSGVHTSFCRRDRGRLGNLDWPIFIKIHSREEVLNRRMVNRFLPEFWVSALWGSPMVNFLPTFGHFSKTPLQSNRSFQSERKPLTLCQLIQLL